VYSAWSPTGTGGSGGKPDFHVPAAFGRLLDA
jgi:alpha-galactosidase